MASDANETNPPSDTLKLNGAPGITGVTLTATLTADKPIPDAPDSGKPDDTPVVTHHSITINGQPLRYQVTTGLMPIAGENGETEARIFFMAYTRMPDGDADTTGEGIPGESSPEPSIAPADALPRPLMFSFNGGPGSSSVWLHLGALGPKRVALRDDGSLPPPPYRLVDNPLTWLDKTDLVFIDPVGTGYSRAATPELGKKFWGVEGDIAAIGEFIRLYLTRYERWTSPLYLVGESYGTTRAAGLSEHLVDRGIALNGILLVSSVLNFQTLLFDTGNDLPYVLFLPTYAATAWFHNRLAPELQADLRGTLRAAEQWALAEYALALAKGAALTGEERRHTVQNLARYTGLSERFLEDSNLRVEIHRFCKELLRDQNRAVGRLDSRITGRDAQAGGDRPDFDPSMTTIRPPYTAVFNHYVRASLGYKTDMPYHILGGGIKTPWEWGAKPGYPDTSHALQSAFAKNPHMRLFVASGYYDLATPYFATDYTLNHMEFDPDIRARIVTAEYESGHMMYIHVPSLLKLKADITQFLEE